MCYSIGDIFFTDTYSVSSERAIEVTYGNLSDSLNGIAPYPGYKVLGRVYDVY
nr:MAG TPA: hypothetical protein [Caudoviricetes sp.]